ncbi:DNA repair protein RecO [Chryseobacterium sp. MFBS3-17]|uniref:DNA repair protein RecO n=1 Tax=Chryseobacterium sp. MFBS3-17 TaxID=2886689 RepID=UPI001D0EB255|nr:DNA repair protein RecO [Chryseobacterium sp. MFBS3-17]MCC2590961.1 DNA repair protein RecO [Chryseobacterium sp. MFBS3-17]
MRLLNGFLLSYLKYGDQDCILHCFTLEQGFQSFFVHRIYAKSNKSKAFLTPLNALSFTVSPKIKTGGILTCSKIELLNRSSAPDSMKYNAVVFFVADFLNQVLRNESENHKIYNEITGFLAELEQENYRAHLIFLMRFLDISGVLPLAEQGLFLDPETGNFGATQVHSIFDETLSALWKEIICSTRPYDTPVPAALRKPFLDSLMVYYYYHFTDFRIPGSLEVVQELF